MASKYIYKLYFKIYIKIYVLVYIENIENILELYWNIV